MNGGIETLRRKVENLKGKLSHIRELRAKAEADVAQSQQSLAESEQARDIIQAVAQETQEQLQHHVSDLASVALAAVFPDPYTVEVEFVQRRNATEADLWFVRDGKRNDPMESTGYGAVDVASFALRLAEWTILRPKPRSVVILDEPFRHVKGEEANARAIRMVREMSRRLGVQVLMVSDERASREVVMAGADRVFEVTLKNGKSRVSVVKE